MVRVMHVHIMFFAVFKNSKSFSEDNMPGQSLGNFIENNTKNGSGYPIKREK